jgi:TetR/AcrR family transcriptional regulator, lmrAB and yxaGH operons repressor
MPRPTSDSRNRLVSATQKLLQVQGYFGTSIKDIAKEAAAPIGSLYYLFPDGKDEIVIEALRRSGEAVRSGLSFVLANEVSPPNVVRAYGTLVRDVLVGSGFTDGCPIATVALETAHHHDGIAEVITDAFRSWTQVLTSALVREGLQPANASALAALCLAAIEGALVVTRAERNKAVFDVVIEQLVIATQAAVENVRTRRPKGRPTTRVSDAPVTRGRTTR